MAACLLKHPSHRHLPSRETHCLSSMAPVLYDVYLNDMSSEAGRKHAEVISTLGSEYGGTKVRNTNINDWEPIHSRVGTALIVSY